MRYIVVCIFSSQKCYYQKKILGNHSTGLQINTSGSAGIAKQHITFARGGTMEQSNKEEAFYNVQTGIFPEDDGSAIQRNEDNSAGNIQVNVGIAGTQNVGSGYSFNLQYNIIKCRNGQKDQANDLRGNIRVVKCKGNNHGYIYHDGGDVIYKIYRYHQACNNDDFMEVRNGKVYIQFCVDI